MEVLNIYSIPLQLQNALVKLYKDTKSRVISPDDATYYFDINVDQEYTVFGTNTITVNQKKHMQDKREMKEWPRLQIVPTPECNSQKKNLRDMFDIL